MREFLDPITPDLGDEEFAAAALDLLRWQSRNNPVYRRFLSGLGVDPLTVTRWQDFPALPASAFRGQAVCCFPPERARAVFTTSGTTGAESGRHYFENLSYYEKSLSAGFRIFMPDLTRHRWISLIPTLTVKPDSSLGYMIDYLGKNIPHDGFQSFCGADYEIDFNRLAHELTAADGKPVALFGASFALATVGEVFQERGKSWRLTADSVIFDTGGYKGRRRELTAGELSGLMAGVFGCAARNIYNEYGMTELSTPGYARLSEGIHRFPPWLRVLIRDPLTMRICAPGERGLVQLYDLANVGSVMALGTLDTAVYERDGIRLLGRVSAADLRGCSLPYEF
ncbi:MAG: hypothetical protein LBD30_08945 [Verrucomicrobiales bacterium]|jgi:phenylacetate-coenzyme A ligase PaaK-like adenylate-forming protein|nr:hypothetical protein [Verrucomicrobiales bacterium]